MRSTSWEHNYSFNEAYIYVNTYNVHSNVHNRHENMFFLYFSATLAFILLLLRRSKQRTWNNFGLVLDGLLELRRYYNNNLTWDSVRLNKALNLYQFRLAKYQTNWFLSWIKFMIWRFSNHTMVNFYNFILCVCQILLQKLQKNGIDWKRT